MNSRVLFALLLVVVFIGAAIVGSRIGRTADPKPFLRKDKVRRTDPGNTRPDQPPAPAVPPAGSESRKNAERLGALLDQYYAAMADKTLSGEELLARVPKDLAFSEETGRVAREKYLKELAAGRLDANWLLIVFRCGGEPLNLLLAERLRDGASDPKEKQTILTELARFSGPDGRPGAIPISDEVFNHAAVLSVSRTPLDRILASALLGNRDSEASRNALWRMGAAETDPASQVAIMESLARVGGASLEVFDRANAMARTYDLKALNQEQMKRFFGGFYTIKRKGEEAYRRDYSSAPR